MQTRLLLHRAQLDWAQIRKDGVREFYNEQPLWARRLLTTAALLAMWIFIEAFAGPFYFINPISLADRTNSALVQAAWFQAIGSVAAICAAIWIAKRQAEHSRSILEEERSRHAAIETGGLILMFYGVALEARAKGQWVAALADHGAMGILRRVLQRDWQRLNLSSIALLEPHYSSIRLLGTDTGMLMAIAFTFLRPYNATLRDVATREYGSVEELRALFRTLAKRIVTAQQISRQALLVLRNHPACTPAMLEEASKLDWYKFGDVDLEADLGTIVLGRPFHPCDGPQIREVKDPEFMF